MASTLNLDTMDVRDEGAPAITEKRDKDGTIIRRAQPARAPWPEGMKVTIKTKIRPSEYITIRKTTNGYLEENEISPQDEDLAAVVNACAHLAVLSVSVSGLGFKLAETPAERLVQFMDCETTAIPLYVFTKIAESANNPFGAKSTANGGKTA